MKKILFLAISIIGIICSNCSKDDGYESNPPVIPPPEEPSTPNEEDTKLSYEDWCKLNSNGYHVKDTTELKVYNGGLPDNDVENCLLGSYKGNLWLGVFNKETKDLIKEYIGSEIIKSEYEYNKGYGEKGIVKLGKLHIQNIFLRDNGFACCMEDDESRMFIFANNGKFKYHITVKGGLSHYCLLLNWYNNTYLGHINALDDIYTGGGWTVFSQNGDIILSSDNYMPLDMNNVTTVYAKDYIAIKYNAYSYTSTPYGGIGINKAYIDNNYGRSTILYKTDKKYKYTSTFNKIENDSLFVSLDITFLSGKIEHKDYKIDIDTWEFREY